jgi:hypothetical protein
MRLSVGIERYNDVTIERLREGHSGQHEVSLAAAKDQRFDRDLPLSPGRIGLLADL